MRPWWLVPLSLVCCRKPHQVTLEAKADPAPDSCQFHVIANSSRGPIADGFSTGVARFVDASDAGESWAITAAVESPRADPACDVGVSCRVLVDGVEVMGEARARRVLCAWTLR
jgi:hypothetical protein